MPEPVSDEYLHDLVARLRQSADALVDMQQPPPVRVNAAIDLRQAANTIEDISKFKKQEREDFDMRLTTVLQHTLHDFVLIETGYEPQIEYDIDRGVVKASTLPLQIRLEIKAARR